MLTKMEEKERRNQGTGNEKLCLEICLLLDTKGMTHTMQINTNKKY